MMTSHSSSPALSNLPLPRISLEQPSERTGGEIYSHASEIHPTIFLHNCWQQRERERERNRWFYSWEDGRSAMWEESEGGEAFCSLVSHSEKTATTFFWFVSCNLPATVRMQEQKKKPKNRTPCSCVTHPWGVAAFLQRLIRSRTELQRLRFKCWWHVGRISELQRAPVPCVYFNTYMSNVCEWTTEKKRVGVCWIMQDSAPKIVKSFTLGDCFCCLKLFCGI